MAKFYSDNEFAYEIAETALYYGISEQEVAQFLKDDDVYSIHNTVLNVVQDRITDTPSNRQFAMILSKLRTI